MTTEDRTAPYRRSGVVAARRVGILVKSGRDQGKSIEIDADAPVSVGVAPDNALVLTDPTVSRYHLELRRTDRGIAVTDLGSRNGTFLGDVLVTEVIVPPGSTLQAGETALELFDGSQVPEPADADAPSVPGLVFQSESMARLALMIERLARSQVSVLIQGETGTGKEVVARALHALSPRAERRFEVVDCGSMPATLVASALFGHERGAFTGADRKQEGAFERADGGTMLLDEIGELPLEVQPALLGVLERKTFRPLGGSREIPVDVRVLAATHRDLRAAVNDGTFRADLYFRLAVSRLVVPPLRARPEDIEPLVRHFALELTGEPNMQPFGQAALDRLRAHPWSGNVRELRNIVENALAMGGYAEAEPAPHAPHADSVRTVAPYRAARASAIDEFERAYLNQLLSIAGTNASEAARLAKMDRPYLLTLLRKHGLR